MSRDFGHNMPTGEEPAEDAGRCRPTGSPAVLVLDLAGEMLSVAG